MDEASNTLKDLLTEQQFKEYQSKEYPFNTNFLGQILKEKLKEDPDSSARYHRALSSN